MKVKKHWKIIFTLYIIFMDVFVYVLSSTFGVLAQHSKFYLVLTLLCWVWLLYFSTVLLLLIWDDDRK